LYSFEVFVATFVDNEHDQDYVYGQLQSGMDYVEYEGPETGERSEGEEGADEYDDDDESYEANEVGEDHEGDDEEGPEIGCTASHCGFHIR
jgi:hypothetical protein